MADWKAHYYPNEIVEVLLDFADSYDLDAAGSCEDALYQIQAMAMNPYNDDYWRDFYEMLEELMVSCAQTERR